MPESLPFAKSTVSNALFTLANVGDKIFVGDLSIKTRRAGA